MKREDVLGLFCKWGADLKSASAMFSKFFGHLKGVQKETTEIAETEIAKAVMNSQSKYKQQCKAWADELGLDYSIDPTYDIEDLPNLIIDYSGVKLGKDIKQTLLNIILSEGKSEKQASAMAERAMSDGKIKQSSKYYKIYKYVLWNNQIKKEKTDEEK